MDTTKVAQSAQNQQPVVDNSYVNRVVVNGTDVSVTDCEAQISACLKGAIMKAQGIVASYIPDFGWMKHGKSVDVAYKGQAAQIVVPQWNAEKQTHEEWKQEAAKRIKGQMLRLNFLRTHLPNVLNAPEVVIKQAFSPAIEAPKDSQTVVPAPVK